MSSSSSSSNSNNEPLESYQKNNVGEETQPGVLVSGDEKVSLGVNSNSIFPDGDGTSGVSVHVDENAVVLHAYGDGSISLVVDYSGPEEDRVSKVVNEFADFMVCEFKNVDEESKDASGNVFTGLGSEIKQFESVAVEDSKVELARKEIDDNSHVRNGNRDFKDHNEGSGADYDSMLSMFDQYASNGKSDAVGYGYEIGDMVWGKVKSHPWWPGHIFNEAFASASVRRTKREGHVLVAFFGDSSYGWFDPAELIPFEPNFTDKSWQTNSRTFVKAVEDAIDELNRRQGLGLACKCRNQFNFRQTNVEGYFAVDVGEHEAGIYSASQIEKSRKNFQPGGMLDFVQQLALTPLDYELENINFVKNRATVAAFRKAVFEEFDETYAQAFGAQPVHPAAPKAPLELSRVPLSGPLVIAEALGKGKASSKSNKSKDQLEKDKYLFKRRNEQNESKIHKISRGQGGSSSQSPQVGGSGLLIKGMHPAVVDHASQTSVSGMAQRFDQSANQQAAVEQFHGQEHIHHTIGVNYQCEINDAKSVAEGPKLQADSGTKKGKHHKHPVGDLHIESSVPVEKTKKRKKLGGKETSSDDVMIPGISVAGATLAVDVIVKPVEIPSVLGDSCHVKHLGNDDMVRDSLLPDMGAKPLAAKNANPLELFQLLDDLRALALDPFHSERSCPATARQIILRFRSLVYQNSLSVLAPGENESKDTRGRIPSPASFDYPDDNLREMSAVKPPKPPTRLDDPTKGRKRGPSGRQEEMTLKKKKKINYLKLLTTEKKAAQKAPDARQGDAKDKSGKIIAQVSEKKATQKSPEVCGKTIAQASEKKATQKPPEVQVGDGREIPRKTMPLAPARVSRSDSVKRRELPARAADPTMLVMKFPAGAALPSSAELRAKFTRFGPLDHSGTRIFWKSSTIRLVYYHKIDAQAALRFATSGTNLFGNTNVRCHLRDVGVESPETESSKVQTEDPYSGISQPQEPPVLQQRLVSNIISQPVLQPVQLKSCLKKPSGDDGASTGGNGSVRGRVKFMLGDEGNNRTSTDDAASSHGLNFNSEKIQVVIPPPRPPSILPAPPTQQFPIAPNNFHHIELAPRNMQTFSIPAVQLQPKPTHIDISKEMVSLLTKCKDVVNNLTGALGYVPYHPL